MPQKIEALLKITFEIQKLDLNSKFLNDTTILLQRSDG